MGHLLGSSRSYVFRRFDEQNQVLKSWSGTAIDWTIKVVCEPCNNNWMSELEQNHAKPTLAPIINGRPVSLLPRGMASASLFAFKTAVIGDQIRTKTLRPTSFFTSNSRSQFRRRLIIPPGVQIWIGAYLPEVGNEGFVKTYYLQVKDGRYHGFEYFVLTWMLSPLVIQIACCRWTRRNGRWCAYPKLIDRSNFQKCAVQLWPSEGAGVRWPPENYVTRDSIDSFHNRWSSLSSRSGDTTPTIYAP